MAETPDLTSKSSFADGNRFFILGLFDDSLNKEIILPLTKKIDELSNYRNPVIEFHINSPGGNGVVLMHIVALFELARRKGIKVRTIVPLWAFSCGSMLAVAGDKGERYIAREAEHVVHYGSYSGWGSHTPLQIERESEHRKRWFKHLVDHYKKYSNIPKLEDKIKDDNFFIPADDCIKWGLADKYMDEL